MTDDWQALSRVRLKPTSFAAPTFRDDVVIFKKRKGKPENLLGPVCEGQLSLAKLPSSADWGVRSVVEFHKGEPLR